MTSPVPLTDTQTAASADICLYMGFSVKKKRIQLIRNGARHFLEGHLRKKPQSSIPFADQQIDFTTPEYQANPSLDRQYTAIHPRTGELFTVYGQLKSAPRAITVSKGSAYQTESAEALTTGKNEKPKTKRATIATFHKQLQTLVEQRKLGIDPDLRMAFLVDYLAESKATLHRKMSLGKFPAPVKRGRGSFWPISLIEQYKAGSFTTSAAHSLDQTRLL
jgi:predicted DNA-binding transcriptional regulator AlpA